MATAHSPAVLCTGQFQEQPVQGFALGTAAKTGPGMRNPGLWRQQESQGFLTEVLPELHKTAAAAALTELGILSSTSVPGQAVL